MKTINLLFLIVSTISLTGCLNKYENKMVGFYKVDGYKVMDSTIKIVLPTLRLKNDKTFVLEYGNHQIKGKWNADDAGDWMLVNFYFNNISDSEYIGGEDYSFIEIANPSFFSIHNLKSITMQRVGQ